MDTEQQLHDHSDTSFHIKSARFMCNTCNRQFCVVTPENGQGKCPRCENISNDMVNEDENQNNRSGDHNVEQSAQNVTSNQAQEPSPAPQRFRVLRIMRRVIFGPHGVIVIETVLPDSAQQQENILLENVLPFQNEAALNQNQESTQSANPGQSQAQNQSQQDRSFFDPFMFLLLGQMNSQEVNGLDSIIEAFLRNDPNKHGPAPATEDNIKSLKEFEFEPEHCRHTQCSVCQEDFNKGDSCVALPCEHDYHKDCVVEWLKLHDSCPNCRKPISSEKANGNDEKPAEQENLV